MKLLSLSLFLLCSVTLTAKTGGQSAPQPHAAPFDVIHYDAQVEPNITDKTIGGKGLIRFVSQTRNLTRIEFDCGELTVDAVREKSEAQKFTQGEHRLSITLARPAKDGERREVLVEYHGAPRRGIRFFPDEQQVYTVFSTSQWMPCVDAPEDKASLRLTLILPAGVAGGAVGPRLSRPAPARHKKTHQ